LRITPNFFFPGLIKHGKRNGFHTLSNDLKIVTTFERRNHGDINSGG
jgi:hypothetical protein